MLTIGRPAVVRQRMSKPRGRMQQSLRVALLIVVVMAASCSSNPATRPDSSLLPAIGSLPAGRPFSFEIGSHCGIRRLGLPVDGRFWITDEAKGVPDWIPREWAATQQVGVGLIAVTVELSPDRERLTASLAGRSVVYRPVMTDDPVVLCA